MRRLIILLLGLLTFGVSADERVIEQQGSWSIIEQDTFSKPDYMLSAGDKDIQFRLACQEMGKRLVFSVHFYNASRLKNLSLSTVLSIKLDHEKNSNDFLSSMFNYNKSAVFLGNYLYYAGYNKNHNTEKMKLMPTFIQLFKQLPSSTGNMTFTANGEDDVVYQSTLSTDGLPTMFEHFAQYCGTEFMDAFDISFNNQ